MIRLIKIELKKIFKKREIILLFPAILIVSFLTIYFCNKSNDINYKVNYEYAPLLSKNEYLKESSKDYYDNYKNQIINYNKDVEENIKILDYSIKEGIDLNYKIKSILEKSLVILSFLSIVVAIIGCSILSSEINKKSIKELITKPYKRWKFLLSKIIALLILVIILSLFLLISMSLLTTIITKVNVFKIVGLFIRDGKVIQSCYYLLFIKKYLLNLVPLIFISIFSVFLSTIITNSTISSSIIIFLLLTGSLLFQLLLKFNIKIIEYTFLPYLDLSIFKDIYSINIAFGTNISMSNGIYILIIYMIVFYILSNIIFNKKDIVNN